MREEAHGKNGALEALCVSVGALGALDLDTTLEGAATRYRST